LKRKLYHKSNLHIVCPSRWIYDQVEQSILKNCASVRHIPVGVDVDTFQPRSQARIREEFGIESDRFVLISVIPSPTNYRKALDLLFKVLKLIRCREDLAVIIVGSRKIKIPEELKGMEIHQGGYIKDETDLSYYYSAADLFCFPSRCDNSAQVLLETAACGIPTVCFNVCGNPEYVIHKKTGLIIEPYDFKAMAEAIDSLQENRDACAELGSYARQYVSAELTTYLQANRFMKLYKNLL
jgi:glycosyltransferase involved in cell wall biosynthesis